MPSRPRISPAGAASGTPGTMRGWPIRAALGGAFRGALIGALDGRVAAEEWLTRTLGERGPFLHLGVRRCPGPYLCSCIGARERARSL